MRTIKCYGGGSEEADIGYCITAKLFEDKATILVYISKDQ